MNRQYRAHLITPWGLGALYAADFDLRAYYTRIPQGFDLMGHASSARGPWTFSLRCEGHGPSVIAHSVADIPDAMERLLGMVVDTGLEHQLAASLEALR